MINVLIVEDSLVIANLIRYILEGSGEFKVCAIAESGSEAVRLAASLSPDVISMDVNLPGMDGLEATRRIMSSSPAPIVICSGDFSPQNSHSTFEALNAGAVAVVEKPHGFGSEAFERISAQFRQTLKLMSEVKVVRRAAQKRFSPEHAPQHSRYLALVNHRIRVAGIGASTGGPETLQKILSGLDDDFALPLIVVQHITPGFVGGFVDWLNQTAKVHVKIAENNEQLTAGYCYIAPDGLHLRVSPARRIVLEDSGAVNGSKPSIGVLMESLANSLAHEAAGILLSGMGKDGAAELKILRDAGGLTVVQDAASCLIFGIPKEAIALDAARLVSPPEEIIMMLNHLNALSPRDAGHE